MYTMNTVEFAGAKQEIISIEGEQNNFINGKGIKGIMRRIPEYPIGLSNKQQQ